MKFKLVRLSHEPCNDDMVSVFPEIYLSISVLQLLVPYWPTFTHLSIYDKSVLFM